MQSIAKYLHGGNFLNLCKLCASKLATPLNVVIATEIAGVALLVFGVIPREGALFLLGIFVYFSLFAPRKQALLFAIISIPLYIAMPITEGFDTMAGWRIIIALLFLRVTVVCIFSYLKLARPTETFLQTLWRSFGVAKIREKGLANPPPFNFLEPNASPNFAKPFSLIFAILRYKLLALIFAFFLVSLLSLFIAQDLSFGIRKILYFVNIFMLFPVIITIIKSKQDFKDVFKYTFWGAIIAVVVGYAQLIAIFFVSLHNFWMWWVQNVIPIFYGNNLSNLLSYSNTWFSYYEDAEPTLRVFSVLPDSHSFALLIVLLLPMALAYYVVRRTEKKSTFFFEATIVLGLLGVLFSGTRGMWVGIMPVFVFAVLAYFALCKPRFRKNFPAITSAITFVITQLSKPIAINEWRSENKISVIKASIFVFMGFALLFPVAGQIQRLSQISQGGRVSGTTTFARISSSLDSEELSNKGRIQIWKSTVQSIAKNPLLGVGIGNYPVVLGENVSATKKGASAHSLYLDFMAEIGILGGLIVILIFLEILRKSISVFLRSNDLFFSSFAGFFSIFLLWIMAYSVVDVVLISDKILLVFVTLVSILYANFNQHSSLQRGEQY